MQKWYKFVMGSEEPVVVSVDNPLPVQVQGTFSSSLPVDAATETTQQANNTLLTDISTKLDSTLSVNVTNQIDLTTVTSHLLAIKSSVAAIDTNTDTVEQKILDTITAINSNGTVNHSDLLSVITQLQAVNANTDTEEALLTSVLAKIIAAPATEAKQDSMLGTQGTGSDYNQPTGGTGLLGMISGLFRSTKNITTTGTLTALNSVVDVEIGNKGALGIQLVGTNTGSVVTFYASMDSGTTYITVNVIPMSNGGDNNPVGTTTVAGNWSFIGGAFTNFRVKLTTAGSGSFAVTAVATPNSRNVGISALGSALDTAATTSSATSTLIAVAKGSLQKSIDLIALLPSSLGIKTSAGSISMVGASDAIFTVQGSASGVGLPIASAASRSQITVTRPANVTAYTAGDVIGGVITFTSMGVAASMQMLTSVDLRIDIAALPSGMSSMRLHFYSATPPSAYADNAAWDLPSGDRSVYIGYIDLGIPVDLGSTLFCQVDSVNKHMKLGTGETSIYAYLVTAGGFTPAANSEVYVPTLRAVAL